MTTPARSEPEPSEPELNLVNAETTGGDQGGQETAEDESPEHLETNESGENTEAPAPDRGRRSRGTNQPKRVLTKVEILQKLEHLAGMLAMGLIKPSVANAIRANYETMLKYLETTSTSALPTETALSLIKDNPQAFALLSDFLTDEQFAAAKEYLDGEQEA